MVLQILESRVRDSLFFVLQIYRIANDGRGCLDTAVSIGLRRSTSGRRWRSCLSNIVWSGKAVVMRDARMVKRRDFARIEGVTSKDLGFGEISDRQGSIRSTVTDRTPSAIILHVTGSSR
jgi:hypothetical protein